MNTDKERNVSSSIGTILFPLLFVEKKKRFAYLATCLAFILTLFFFSPLDYYLNNSHEFLIGIGDVVFPLLLICPILLAIVVFLPPLILRRDTINGGSLLLIGLTAAFYFQVLFLNGEMIRLDGSSANYSEWNIKHILNLAIWMEITFLPLYAWNRGRQGKIFKNIKWETGIICASAIILGMQVAGIIAAAPRYNPGEIKNSKYYLSYDKAFELSSRENICVFLMDMFDVAYMNEILESNPELYDELDGFTFYENNTSLYKNTPPSVTNLLTGYIPHRSDKYIMLEEVWKRRGFIDILRENGYSAMLLPSVSTNVGTYERLIGKADNLLLTEKPPWLNHSVAAKVLLTFSFEKIMPYLLKFYFAADNFGASFNNLFFEWGLDDSLLPTVSPDTDIIFYDRLKTVGLSVQNETKTFNFTHFNSAHDGGYRYNKETGKIEKGYVYSNIEAARGSLAILSEYFRRMKELGIYDSSTIIIIADHGEVPSDYVYERTEVAPDGTAIIINTHKKLARAITAVLLIKPQNSRGKLETDKISELSHKNFGASILEIAGLPREGLGLSYFDIIRDRISQTREFFVERWGDDRYIARGWYVINGDANDISNWKYMPYEDQ